MTESFVMDPMREFQRFINYRHRPREFQRGFEAGVMGLALELITVVRTLEALPYEDKTAQEETISTIFTLLRGLELDELAVQWYERVNGARKTRFVAEPDASLPDIASASPLGADVPIVHASLGASLIPEGQASLGTPVAPDSDRSLDRPFYELAQQFLEESKAKQIELLRSPDKTEPQADESE